MHIVVTLQVVQAHNKLVYGQQNELYVMNFQFMN